MTPELQEALEGARAEYSRIFGRQPRRTDPVLLSMYIAPEENMTREIVKGMRSAGINEELIYVFQKTGFMPSQDNQRFLSEPDKAEIRASIKDYRRRRSTGEQDITRDVLRETLLEWLRDCQIVMLYFTQKWKDPIRDDFGTVFLLAKFLCLAAGRLIRSVLMLLENDASLDASALLRSFYEIVLTLWYVRLNPSDTDVVSGSLGVLLGTHELAKNSRGEPIQTRVVRKSDGLVLEVPSRWGMAKSLGDEFRILYRSFYAPHCEVSHNDVSVMNYYRSPDGPGLKLFPSDQTYGVGIEVLLLSALFWQALTAVTNCKKYLAKDLAYATRKCVLGIHAFERSLQDAKGGGLAPDFMAIVNARFPDIKMPT